MLWIIIASLAYGILAFLDPFLFTYIAYNLSVSGLYLGILNALWSISYIVSNRLLNNFADSGHNKLLLAISILSISISMPMLSNLNLLNGVIAYVLHSISMASMNLSLSVTLLEYIDSEMWKNITSLQKALSNITRGMMLLIAAFFRSVLTIENMIIIAIIFSVLSLLAMPSILFTFERNMFRFYRNLRSLSLYLKASSSLMFIDRPKVAISIFEKYWNYGQTISIPRIIIAVLMVTALGDYIFTVIPYVLRNIVSLQGMWIAYGIAAILSALILLIVVNAEWSSKSLALGLIMSRMLILIIGFNYVRNETTLTLYIVVSSLLFLLIDVTLYNYFIEGSAGFNTSLYFISREIGSIVGSILGGIFIGFGTNTYLLVSLVIGIVPIILLI
ncbi:hypothetical protein Igag_1791 [Ignisphaera aggregans DSM 17230]|uniref:MFS transporter n=1 Tax=Ignisphaera aggregans (strain DSM 17230 / JCM 13409 / AQ1.S1) TaxID=583356 RepID=E0SSK3_IGNAA|nr:hypothetical protein Igag_1791 [Ignisphaera aggregans DSM 17230]